MCMRMCNLNSFELLAHHEILFWQEQSVLFISHIEETLILDDNGTFFREQGFYRDIFQIQNNDKHGLINFCVH